MIIILTSLHQIISHSQEESFSGMQFSPTNYIGCYLLRSHLGNVDDLISANFCLYNSQ